MTSSVYEYKGHKYQPWDDYEEDNRKTFHDVINPDGSTCHFSCSPYHHPSRAEFELWIDLGKPPRLSGNFRCEADIREAAAHMNAQ